MKFENYLEKRLENLKSSNLLKKLKEKIKPDEDGSIFSINIDDLKNINVEKILSQNESDSKESDSNDDELISNEIIKALFELDEIKEIVDLNNDGEISNEEGQEFLNSISVLDEDKENLSLDDIDLAISELGIDLENKLNETPPTTSTGGGSYTPSLSTTPPSNDTNESTPEELNKQLEDKKTELAKAQDKYKAACNGSDSEVQKLKEIENATYEKLQEKLADQPELQEKLKKANDAVASKEEEIAADEISIQDFTNKKNQTEANITHLGEKITQYNNSITSLETQLSNTEDKDQKAQIEAKIGELEAALEETIKQKTQQEELLNEYNSGLENAIVLKGTHEKELEIAKENLNNILESINVTDEQGNDLAKAYQDAKAATETKQNELKEITQKEITNIQKEISNIESAIQTKELKEIEKQSKVHTDYFEPDLEYKLETFTDESGMQYLVMGPKDIQEGEELPMIMYLHGSGENGDSPEYFSKKNVALTNIISNSGLTNFRGYIVCPMLKTSGNWCTPESERQIRSIIKNFETTHNVDEDQRFLCGHSLGGLGTQYLSQTMGDIFSKTATFSATVHRGETYTSNIPTLSFYEGKKEGSILAGNSHGDCPRGAYNLDRNHNGKSDLIEWFLGEIDEFPQ